MESLAEADVLCARIFEDLNREAAGGSGANQSRSIGVQSRAPPAAAGGVDERASSFECRPKRGWRTHA